MENYKRELEKVLQENEVLKKKIKELSEKNNITAEKKYQTLFMQLKDVVYESSREGKLIDINPSGVELFGYDSKEELLKINIAEDLYVNPEERQKLLDKLEKEGYVKNYEIKIKTKSGEEIIVLETSYMIKDENGNVTSYSGIIKDVTETKKREKLLEKYNNELAEVNKQLKKSEQELKKLNDEKDKFFSIIAHDLKSPFNALLNLSEFLVKDLSELSMEEIRSFSKEINKSAHSVFDLLLNLLQWAQIKTGRLKQNPEKISLSALANNSIILLESVAAKKAVTIINNIDNSHFFLGDRTMISSVLQNLISNSIKFSRRNSEVILSSRVEGDKIIVSIKDRGVGISSENMKRLFKLDEHLTTPGTSNESGTGLGLILCKELVEKNKGKIWAESKEQFGTTFFFSLVKTEI
jgi:PAS domain S-box-containing protein